MGAMQNLPPTLAQLLIVKDAGMKAAQILQALGLPQQRPLVVLNGSTNATLEALYTQVAPLLQDGLAAWLVSRGAVAITGGTDAGIFAVLGQGLSRYGQPAACIGVTVAACLRHPVYHPQGVALEPHHTHVVLSPGQHWGAETALMYALAAAYGSVAQSLMLLVGGGPLTRNELEHCVGQGRRVLAVAGSGGVADALLAAAAGQAAADPGLHQIAARAELYRIAVDAPTEALAALLDQLLLAEEQLAARAIADRA
jgi:hypothetical protein